MASKVVLSQLGQDVIDFIENNASGGGGATRLEKEIISNIAVGAAAAGTIFPQSQSFTDFAESILRTDIVPTISTSFSGTGIKEKGTSVNGSTATLTITNLPSVTVEIKEINFYDNNILLKTIPFAAGKSVYTYTYTSLIKDNTTLKAELVYGANKKVFGTGTFTFVYASYYGTTQLSSVGDEQAQALIASFSKTVKTSKALTWSNIVLNDARFCYMYPVSFGTLSSIKDGNGFSQIDGYSSTTVNIVSPLSGETVSYYVYLLTDPATGSGFTQIYA